MPETENLFDEEERELFLKQTEPSPEKRLRLFLELWKRRHHRPQAFNPHLNEAVFLEYANLYRHALLKHSFAKRRYASGNIPLLSYFVVQDLATEHEPGGQYFKETDDSEELENLREENSRLSAAVGLLNVELRKNVPHRQLYRFGAGVFSLSLVSLLSWGLTGVSIPFHPAFALVMTPLSVGFMVMAWLSKRLRRTAIDR